MVRDFFSFFAVLVKKDNFVSLENGQFVKALVEICGIWTQDRSRVDILRYAAALLMLLVQVGGPQLSSLTQITMAMIQDPGLCSSIFPVLFSVLASGLIVDPTNVLPMLDDNTVMLIGAHVSELEALPLSYMKVCFMGLCALARNGAKDAFCWAVTLTKAIVTCERLQGLEECEDEAAIPDEWRHRHEIELPSVDFPLDSYDIRAVFKQTQDETHMFDELPPDVKEFVMTSFLEPTCK